MTLDRIRTWFEDGVRMKATHLLVVCDTFDYTFYPVLSMPGEDVTSLILTRDEMTMTRVEEVYDLSLPMESQIAESRAWHT